MTPNNSPSPAQPKWIREAISSSQGTHLDIWWHDELTEEAYSDFVRQIEGVKSHMRRHVHFQSESKEEASR